MDGTAVLEKLSIGGREKAAILLVTLGQEKSASIFKHLKEDEIEALTLQIANTSVILPQAREAEGLKQYQTS